MQFLDPPGASIPLPEPSRSLPPLLHAGWWGGPACEGIAMAPARFGGIVVQPAEVVLGLRGWEDAFEGILAGSNTPYVFFELEKIIRMMLRQSPMALEILAAPTANESRREGFDPRDLIRWLTTSRILDSYLDFPAATDLATLRPLLTAALLAKQQQLSLSLTTLLEQLSEVSGEPLWRQLAEKSPDADVIARADAAARGMVRAGIEAGAGANSLPASPIGYDEANALLVRWRLRVSNSP